MSAVLCSQFEIGSAPPTSRAYYARSGLVSNQRAPTDPYYFADVDVKNMVVGSRYMLGYDNAGSFTQLASGICSQTDFTIASVPAYANPFLLELRVRKSSTGTKYIPAKSFGYHTASGVTLYVAQTVDEVAT